MSNERERAMTDRGEREKEREKKEIQWVWQKQEINGEHDSRKLEVRKNEGKKSRKNVEKCIVCVCGCTWVHACAYKRKKSKVKGRKENGKRRKSANGNPLIRTWKQQQLSWESEEQQKDVTDNYCEHGSIQYKHPCVLLRRRVTLKIRCHLFSCFSSSKRQSVKNKHRGNRHFSVYSVAIMPSGKIGVLMKHIRQIEAVEALTVCIQVCRCGSVRVSAFYPSEVRLPGGNVVIHWYLLHGIIILFTVHYYQGLKNRQENTVLTCNSYPHAKIHLRPSAGCSPPDHS